MYKVFCNYNAFTQFIWLKDIGLSLLFFLEMDNFLGPWLIAYTAMLIQCFSMFHFLSGCPWGQHAIKKCREANSFYVKKRQNGGQNFLKILHVPFPLQWGLFLQGGDRSFLVIWQTELEVDLEWTQNYSVELLALYLCQMIMHDYLSTVIEWCC